MLKLNQNLLLVSGLYALINTASYAAPVYSNNQDNGYNSSGGITSSKQENNISSTNSVYATNDDQYVPTSASGMSSSKQQPGLKSSGGINQPPANMQSSQNNVEVTESRIHPKHHSKKHFSFSINGQQVQADLSGGAPHIRIGNHGAAPQWINAYSNSPLPSNAVIGGHHKGQPFYICRAPFSNSVQPGKIVHGQCHITFGGNEIIAHNFQVLVSNYQMNWVPAGHGIPVNAIQAGDDHGVPLFVCKANFEHSVHPGKVVRNSCVISKNGREIALNPYKILIQS